jgi:hypothetical protein
MRESVVGCVLLMLAACSGGDAPTDGRNVRRSDGTPGAPAAGKSGGSTPGFGSQSPGAIVNVTPLETPSVDGGMGTSVGVCEAGAFCGPQGPDPDNCGTLRLEQDVEITRNPGNLLIVFDQSFSMQEPWGDTGITKLQAAQAAVMTAVSSLQDSLTVGAIFFPSLACIPAGGAGGIPGLPPGVIPEGIPGVPAGGPVVEPIDGPGQIPFQPGAQFLVSWADHWAQAAAELAVGTPMQEAFDRADSAIQSTALNGLLAVVAFTDGQPNCFPAEGMMTATEPTRAAAWLADKNIKTYVVGLPGAQGVDILNNVAVSGGTMEYLLPDDPAALELKLKDVVSSTVKMGFDSCSINLNPAADPADKLLMVVEENGVRSRVDHMLSADAGWTISADGVHVEITGRLCEDAKAGRFDAITFEYGCKELPPLPPPMGPI